MRFRLCKASLRLACMLFIGLVAVAAPAGEGRVLCLDNQLLRVSSNGAAWGRWGFVERHRRHLPLESRLTCLGAPRAERSA